jgi:PIN domain nuclease of toxin-antitoxin system
VLDASALLAMMLEEPGGNRVAAVITEAAISAVNLSEAADYYARQGMPRDMLSAMFADLPIEVVLADIDQAIDAAMLRPSTQKAGLSLGDRYCLALARQLGCEALTTDRAWLKIAKEVDVRVTVIR